MLRGKTIVITFHFMLSFFCHRQQISACLFLTMDLDKTIDEALAILANANSMFIFHLRFSFNSFSMPIKFRQ